MRRSEVYSAISLDIASRLKNDGKINGDRYDEIKDDVDSNDFEDLFLEEYGTLGIYEGIARQISSWDNNDDYEITVCSNMTIGTVAPDYEHYFRHFHLISGDDFTFTTTDKLHECQSSVSDTMFKVIERIWAAISGNSVSKSKFWDFVTTETPDKYVIVSNYSVSTDSEKWRLYSYAHFNYVNECSHSMDSRLEFNRATKFAPQIPFTTGKPYEQFFEVYELISESHYCDDILSRFLNMYQILENMVYRRHLVELTSGNLKRNRFVRKTINTVNKAFKTENEEVPRGIIQIFSDLDAHIPISSFSQDAKDFIKREYNLTIGATCDSITIAKLVYNLRNSIVHNKATELHFSFENIDEYEDIIDVIKTIINNVEPLIINRINTYEHGETTATHPLEYTTGHLTLY